jgi:hypothetical protein
MLRAYRKCQHKNMNFFMAVPGLHEEQRRVCPTYALICVHLFVVCITYCVGFEVFTAVTIKNAIFWDEAFFCTAYWFVDHVTNQNECGLS